MPMGLGLGMGITSSGGVFDLPGEDEVPVALIDFTNAVYQADGEDVARATLVGDSEEYIFNDANIVPSDGFKPTLGTGLHGFAIKGAAAAQMLSTGRMVIVATTDQAVSIDVHNGDWSYYVEVALRNAYIYDSVADVQIDDPAHSAIGDEHTYIVALADGFAGFAVDAAEPTVTSSGFTPYGASPPTELQFKVSAGNEGATDGGSIKSISVYPWP